MSELINKIFSGYTIFIPFILLVIKTGINDINSTPLEKKLNKNLVNFQYNFFVFLLLFVIYFVLLFVLTSDNLDKKGDFYNQRKDFFIIISVISVLIALFVQWFTSIINFLFIPKHEYFVKSEALFPNDGEWKLIRSGKYGHLVKNNKNIYRILNSIENAEFVENRIEPLIRRIWKKFRKNTEVVQD